MDIQTFLNSYSLHDSLLEQARWDPEKHEVTLIIDLCCWLQKTYSEGQPETALIKVSFHGVSSYLYENDHPESDAILSAGMKNGQFQITTMNDKGNRCNVMTISAARVEVFQL